MNVPRVPVLQVVSCRPVLPPPEWLVDIGRGVDRTYNTSSNTSQENKWFMAVVVVLLLIVPLIYCLIRQISIIYRGKILNL